MHLITGLGNPGDKYRHNRHNIGFMVVDALQEKFGRETFRSKFHGEYAQAEIGGKKILLLKPTTFMNRSGIAVQECSQFFKVPKGNIIVIHDELDLDTARVKVKIGGSNAGHNGLKSIDALIGPEYLRLRFGISHPGDRDRVADYVLSNFSTDEMTSVNEAVRIILTNIEQLLTGDLPGFMNNCSIQMKDTKG